MKSLITVPPGWTYFYDFFRVGYILKLFCHRLNLRINLNIDMLRQQVSR